MVLTDRQRHDLHAGIYEYLLTRPGEAFQRAAAALAEADPDACARNNSSNAATTPKPSTAITPLLEKKWTAIPRLQKKVLELERAAAQNAKIHAHRTGASSHTADAAGGTRRMLPRLPANHVLKGHSAVVLAVEVHPVFTMVVSGSEDGTIKVWDHESGEYIRTLKGHTSTVNALSFCPTGTHLASCSTDLSIKLWDFTNTYTCLRTLRGHDHTISSVKFAPSAVLLSAANNNNNNNHNSHSSGGSGITNGGTSDHFGTSTSATGMDEATTGSAFLLSASRDQTVKLWQVDTGFCDHTMTHHTDWVRCLAVRSSETSFLWASSGNDQVIFVYEHRDKVMELRGHEHVVESLAFLTEPPAAAATSASSHHQKQTALKDARDYLASGGRDRTVRLWKVSSGECLAVFKNHDNWVRSVLIHPSGNYIISAGDDRSIRVFDIKANRCLRTLDGAHPHFVTSLAMHYTLPILISGGVDQTIRCWLLD